MVAIRFFSTIFAIIALLTPVRLLADEVKPRIAGLENNKEYMKLLADDVKTKNRIDSLALAMKTLREKFLDEEDRRKEISAEILRLESESFTAQSERNKLIKNINDIEQKWIVVNMNSHPTKQPEQPEPEVVAPVDTRKYADLTRNAYFRTISTAADYEMLRKAQQNEKTAVRLLGLFDERYNSLKALRNEYNFADNESSADSLMTLFLNRQAECNILSDSLSATWSYVFDNKTYIYDLLFDKEGRHDMLNRAEANLLAMRQNIDRERGVYLSDALVDYTFQKRCVVDYEIDVAQSLGLDAAVDSLSKVKAALSKVRYDYQPIEIKRRYFLDYYPVKFLGTKYFYTSQNPMPECAMYDNGEMYRIKLGVFSERQPLSKFRGLENVAYQINAAGKWVYYAGAYPSVDALEKDLQTVIKLGFRSADVAAWIDGTYAGTREAIKELKSKSYTIEILGVETLSDGVRRVIEQMSEGNELSRVGKSTYLVTGFRSREAADVVVRGIVSADPALKVNVTEVQ